MDLSMQSIARIKIKGRDLLLCKDSEGAFWYIEKLGKAGEALGRYRELLAERSKSGRIIEELQEKEIFGNLPEDN